ncbi:four helix bundle protein [Flavobacterium ovatum]|uniref:four helix bundle protein n=1 Tax=Flavobacterium ovatum TaxID=1928857 RepID=UPI00344C86ED
MSESIIKNKSFLFAIRIVKLYQLLISDRKEFVMSKQLLRSGTSVGANIREAINGQSKADFVHKLSISQKECDESLYWLELLKETNYITEIEFESINKDALEILKILKSIITTTKNKK